MKQFGESFFPLFLVARELARFARSLARSLACSPAVEALAEDGRVETRVDFRFQAGARLRKRGGTETRTHRDGGGEDDR